MSPETLHLLAAIPSFAALSPEELDRVQAAGREQALPPETRIVSEGDEGETLYLILAGSVRIERGDGTVIAHRGAGAFFGEIALFSGSPRTASVITEASCRLFALDRQDMMALLSSSPQMFENMLAGLTERTREVAEAAYAAQLRAAQATADAEIARLQSVSKMVASVAHEINTPLGIIHQAATFVQDELGAAQIEALAADKDVSEALKEIAEACGLILSNATRAAKLIRAFKNLSAWEITGVRKTVALRDLVDEVLILMKPMARAAGLRIVLDDQLGADCAWTGAPGHLERVLLNLVENVARYAYTDGGPLHLCLARAGAGYLITVRDEGAGIDPNHLSCVFDPFFTTDRDRGGTGLGLTIVHNLVTSALGGHIEVRSTPGKGATFLLEFPLSAPLTADPDLD